MKVNQQIHRMVIDIAANPVLLSVWQSLAPRVERARTLPNLDRARWTAALFEHSKMFAALAARDGALLRRLASEHFLNGLPTLRSLQAAPPIDEQGPEEVVSPPPKRSRRAS
jgi:DNA-binding GntR family transcriptional regulator